MEAAELTLLVWGENLEKESEKKKDQEGPEGQF